MSGLGREYERYLSSPSRHGRPAAGTRRWRQPALIAVLVAFASFTVQSSTPPSVMSRLPYIAGGMGVSEDEASWVVTTYLVANAVILTASSFMARLFGSQDLLHGLPGTVHRKLTALRNGVESAVPAAVSRPPGHRRRAAWCRLLSRSCGTRFLRKSVARFSRSSALQSLWHRLLARSSAAGCPTIIPGIGAF